MKNASVTSGRLAPPLDHIIDTMLDGGRGNVMRYYSDIDTLHGFRTL